MGRTSYFKPKPMPEDRDSVLWVRNSIKCVRVLIHQTKLDSLFVRKNSIVVRAGLETETFRLRATSLKSPQATGKHPKYNTFDSECIKRKGIVVMNNKDHLCSARALVVAEAYADNTTDLIKLRDSMWAQTGRTSELLEKSGVKIPIKDGGISGLEEFQDPLTEYTITVYK
ncbi:hypothetical protein JTB14_022050 [Gonioctena quinquepunctata]|nr:hypothetical protein JTB14_022050 [Gonioctena quinquepunctata]